jgi:hypothetical protein
MIGNGKFHLDIITYIFLLDMKSAYRGKRERDKDSPPLLDEIGVLSCTYDLHTVCFLDV